MKQRIANILSPRDLGASGTHIEDIRIQSPISRLTFSWEFTVVTVSVMTARVVDCISKIEVVDGSRTIVSMSGSELAAYNFYNRKRMPYFDASLTVGGKCKQVFGIDFGRWLWDEDFALNPDNFENLQIHVTWNEDEANASVVANNLGISAYVMDNPAKYPRGYIALKEQFSYAMTASEEEHIGIPIDHPVRSILIQAESEDHDPIALISKIRLEQDNGLYINMNMDFDEFYQCMKQKYPSISEVMTLDDAVTAKTIYANVSKNIHIDIQYDETDFVTAQSNFALPTPTGHKLALAASVDIKAQKARISGECPFNTVCYLVGDEWTPHHVLSPNDMKKLSLVLTASAAADSGDTTRICTEQYIMYRAA